MSGPVYCILSGGTVHCIPVTAFRNTNKETLEIMARSPPINCSPDSNNLLPHPPPASILIEKKNLLFKLNNPSLSDLESDASRGLSNGSHTQDEDETLFDAQHMKFASQKQIADSNEENSHLSLTRTNDDLNTEWFRDNQAINSRKPFSMDTERNGGDDFEYGSLIQSILNEYSTHAVYLPQYFVDIKGNLESNYTQIRSLLTKIFPSWSHSVSIKQLTGGITNMLLSCSRVATNETLLMRVYGQGTNLIIDRNREFVSHLVLNSLKLAPSIHARFGNGLIYGFLPGRSLDPSELSSKFIFPLIAQQLGNWHNSINCEYIEDGVRTIRKYTVYLKKRMDSKPLVKWKSEKTETKLSKPVNDIWDLMEDWVQIVPQNPALVSIFRQNTSPSEVTAENVREVVMKELGWLKRTLKQATKSPVVVSHCDLLAGNIIVSASEEYATNCASGDAPLPSVEENPIQFIDYEYMLPAPRAFDIANHFAEWQGFDCNRAATPDPSPSNPVMVSWCRAYLNDANAPEETVRALIDEIACYYGMPGFYWGIWAMIQSEISTINFNYTEYSKLRLEEYWLWKKQFLHLQFSRGRSAA